VEIFGRHDTGIVEESFHDEDKEEAQEPCDKNSLRSLREDPKLDQN
jgi:hypothetical protein